MAVHPQTATNPAMHTMRICLVGDESHAETLMNMLHAMDGVAQVEVMPPPRARFGDGDGDAGDAVSHIEVAVNDGAAARRIRTVATSTAILLDATAKFVDRFDTGNS
ncbi:MAG: hypothetical protein EPN40_00950 [Rhodanobacteraceae bacterium]|nr:MAG: hypothetical protein EPN40_00950 [Rhodanobacteraceae bacterium]